MHRITDTYGPIVYSKFGKTKQTLLIPKKKLIKHSLMIWIKL